MQVSKAAPGRLVNPASLPAYLPAGEWQGKTAFVVGTGPSLDLAQVRAIALKRTTSDAYRVVAVNDAVLVLWLADICFAGDGKWWNARRGLQDGARFPGIRVGVAESLPMRVDYCDRYVRRVGKSGCSVKAGEVFCNYNSGAMAVQAIAPALPARIVLVGIDMKLAADGTRHFFGPYEQTNLRSAVDPKLWADNFAPIAEALRGKLFSATPGSALNLILPELSIDMA